MSPTPGYRRAPIQMIGLNVLTAGCSQYRCVNEDHFILIVSFMER